MLRHVSNQEPVTLYLQKVSACSHIQPYLGVCSCGAP